MSDPFKDFLDELDRRRRGTDAPAWDPDEVRDAPATPWAADLVGLNRFRGRLEPIEPGAGRLVVDGGGEVVVAWPADLPAIEHADVTALLRPSDVSLSLSAPTSGSARNMLRGRIHSIALETERARVRVDSTPPVVAEITLGSVQRLRLATDTEVWVTFKAVEPRIVLDAAQMEAATKRILERYRIPVASNVATK